MEDSESDSDCEIEQHPDGKSIMNNKPGFGIGEQVLITGIALSSAPLIVPPLVAFSSLGFALWVPFGVMFVSYTCTHNLMAKLLPIPTSSLHEHEKKDPKKGLKQGFELDLSGDVYRQRTESLISNANANAKGDERVDETGYYTDDDDDEDEDETRENVKEEVKGEMGDIKGDDSLGESGSHGLLVKDIERREPVIVKEVEAQKLVKVGEMGRVVISGAWNEENNFDSREVEEVDMVGREVVGDDAKDAWNMQSKEKIMGESMGWDELKVTSKADKKMPSKEEYLDEEKIWEKIGAMRAIVGYKAPRQPTNIGELKALYLFTGVEPPVTFKGGDLDLDEVNDKLKFLMSIVGVK